MFVAEETEEWRVVYADETAEAEVLALPIDMQAKFKRISELIRVDGLAKVHEPYIKHVEDKIWEMRLNGRDGIARSLYVTAIGKRVVIVRTFVKKTEKTPRSEIELAKKRAKDLI
jgi:phage-related protein